MSNFSTPQEEFWAGDFGEDYVTRNKIEDLYAPNLRFFSRALSSSSSIESIIEFGPNVGGNLKALSSLYPQALLSGVELNKNACKALKANLPEADVVHQSILDFIPTTTYDLALIKGVLIHINPDCLSKIYEKLYNASQKYILVCEYYNPTPVSINYRGHDDRLFKRDFAGELCQKFPDISIVDYGFIYKSDPAFKALDDITWFLLTK